MDASWKSHLSKEINTLLTFFCFIICFKLADYFFSVDTLKLRIVYKKQGVLVYKTGWKNALFANKNSYQNFLTELWKCNCRFFYKIGIFQQSKVDKIVTFYV